MNPPKNTRERLIAGLAGLETLLYCRKLTGNPTLGWKFESDLLDPELEILRCETLIRDSREEEEKIRKESST